ncbi:prostaglandin E synthase 2-like [Diadema setosum]|uniref:prostaglandin E synthase 2-like n=1 Tax=Diadema setosum TaxID=31175 RepID=UPI003B3B3B25
MAAPMRYAILRYGQFSGKLFLQNAAGCSRTARIDARLFSRFRDPGFISGNRFAVLNSLSALSGLMCGAYLAQQWAGFPGSQPWGLPSPQAKQRKETYNRCTDESQPMERRPRVLSHEDGERLNLTLYQYQVCPFCCKLRAYLDYFGVPYTIVEVDPIFRKEIKFSEYRKVPILLQRSPGKEDIQMNDSSVIISVLTSFMVTDEKDLHRLVSYFPKMTFTNEKGKEVSEFVNKYNIMLGTPGLTKAEKAEMKWRAWVDDVLVHNLPPNIYRSPSEAIQAFDYISSKGNFGAMQQFIIKYIGAAGMFFVSKRLKKKYNIPDDVRQSLYDAANDWMGVVGDQDFMGGAKPNLADLSVYGVLSSIEGLDAFNDMCRMTKIGPWYKRMRKAVNSQAGAR